MLLSLFLSQIHKSNNMANSLLFSPLLFEMEPAPSAPCAWPIIYTLHGKLIPLLNMLHFRNFNYRRQHEEEKESNACLL